MVELGKQPTLGQDFGTHRERLEGIQVCLEQLFLEVFQGLDAAIGLIQRQNDEQRVNPVFFLRKSRKKARRQDQNQVHCEYDSEDVVEVQSKHIAQFLVSFINSYALLIGRVLKIQNLSVFLTPPPELAVAAMDEVAPTRQCYTMLKASIRHYIRSIGGDHILGLSGRDLGLRKGPVTGLFHMDLVFTNDFKRDAVRGANVKKLSDLTGRDADLQYRKLYKRFSYERSYPRSVLIEQIGGISRPNRDSHHYQQDIYSLVQEREYRMSSTAW
jgi:hypothetical protein